MQGTQVQFLVREEFTCHRTPEPMHHDSSPRVLQLLKPARLEPVLHTRGATEMRSLHTATREEPPLATAREKACVLQTQDSQTNK